MKKVKVNNPAAVALGKISTAKKARAARKNGKLGGRPRTKQSILIRPTSGLSGQNS